YIAEENSNSLIFLNAVFSLFQQALIIEVLSPSTEAADRGIKFAKYRQFSTLQEYVLVQVEQPGVEMFRRNQQGQWVLSEYGLGDSLQLESVNLEIAIADLYHQVKFS
ncbi:Uma2 family endonuclease, partial [Microcoleus sp. LAD1_D5]|uniref:Uma2 family endonuclease n=1 Tax=unclassified Microcoleus TaxID=2642155 RepID=UPI002FD1D312